MSLTMQEARHHINERVTYMPNPFTSSLIDARESGIITAVNDVYVMVRFDGDHHSKACAPYLLELANVTTNNTSHPNQGA